MSKSQRTKGATYEREIAFAFSEGLGSEFKRNIGQARDGGNDIDVGPLVVECKRRKRLTVIGNWFAQAQAAIASKPRGGIPTVVCREDNGESLVVIRLSDFIKLARPELLRLAGAEQLPLFE